MTRTRIARGCAALAVALFALLSSAATARATTVAVPTDDELFAASRAVVEGTVAGIRSRRVGREIFTYVTVDVSRVHAGDIPAGRIVLKQMGGRVGDDFSQLYGSPEFRAGERVLLYLNADDDGALHTAFLFVGKLSVVSRGGRDAVVRDGAPAGVLALRPEAGGATDAAPYDEYVAALERRARADKRPAPAAPVIAVPRELAVAAAPGDETVLPKFTILAGNARWFEPDDGVAVPYTIRYTGFLPDGGLGAVTDALAAWSGVPDCSLELVLERDTELCGFVRDGENTVSFDDCRGQIDGGGCFGIIAIGGASGRVNERKTVNGVEFVRITDADVVLNNNQDTCLIGHRLTLREVITHEIGHSIGLGHSSQSGPEPDPRLAEATMYYQLHEDGRGASLKPDDVDGVRFVYPAAVRPPAVSTSGLAAANAGSAYEARLEASGGSAPYAWAVTGGALPEGLALSPDGMLSGTPAARGLASFAVTVTDARGLSGSRDLALEVLGPKPVVASAVWRPGRKRLKISAAAADAASLEVWVNGARVAPPARTKVKAGAGGALKVTIKGAAAALNVTRPVPMCSQQ